MNFIVEFYVYRRFKLRPLDLADGLFTSAGISELDSEIIVCQAPGAAFK